MGTPHITHQRVREPSYMRGSEIKSGIEVYKYKTFRVRDEVRHLEVFKGSLQDDKTSKCLV